MKKAFSVEPAAFVGAHYIAHLDDDGREPCFTMIRKRDQLQRLLDGNAAVLLERVIERADSAAYDAIAEVAFDTVATKTSGGRYSRDGLYSVSKRAA